MVEPDIITLVLQGFAHGRMAPVNTPRRWIALISMTGLVLSVLGCARTIPYTDLSVNDRRTNLSGLAVLFGDYLQAHPDVYQKFSRILKAADAILENRPWLSKRAVMRWLDARLRVEGLRPEEIAGVVAIRAVYLKGWDGAAMSPVSADDRELLYDLMAAVMGGMHRCPACDQTEPHP